MLEKSRLRSEDKGETAVDPSGHSAVRREGHHGPPGILHQVRQPSKEGDCPDTPKAERTHHQQTCPTQILREILTVEEK